MNEAMFQEILESLESPPKSIPSKYFQRSPEVDPFHLNEYYFNRCEKELLAMYADKIAKTFSTEEFNLVELGADPSGKSHILISEFLKKKNFFSHYIVDPHEKALEQAGQATEEAFPHLLAHQIRCPLLMGLKQLTEINHKKKAFLLLGSQLSQKTPEGMIHFMQTLRFFLKPGDVGLVGFPMKFVDQASTKAEHQLNVLLQLNNELGADFDPSHYKYIEVYNDMPATCESFLVSTQPQKVRFLANQREVKIEKNERILTGSTALLSEEEIDLLMQTTGFKVEKFFYDHDKIFADVLIVAQ